MLWRILAIKLDPKDIGVPEKTLNNTTVSGVLSQVFFWGGVLAVVMIIIGGILYVVSSGDETNMRRAKATITYSVVGLVVMVLSFAIVKFVAGVF